MPSLKTILVIDDNVINRIVLSKILSESYVVLEAEDGQSAIEILNENADEIAAVMLDIVMPVMDGYDFLVCVRKDERYKSLPIIVMTNNNENENEIKALRLGAWDFVSKPYNAEIIKFRLKNAIDRSQLAAFTRLKYLAEYDVLTGIYNKHMFFDETRKMIDESKGETFVMFRMDIDRFQLVNSFFGTNVGDQLLLFIAKSICNFAYTCDKATYGRIESDIFCFCMLYDETSTAKLIKKIKNNLAEYNVNYDIVPSIGIYLIDNNEISVETMYNRATLAAKTCKGSYMRYYAFYDDSMGVAITREQEIINEMNFALENNQFQIYLQPKYNINNNFSCGAEVLVRWMHPQKGMMMPNEFIPVFERNGFITKLDLYVWEQACKCLRRWIDMGIESHPISVNVSRVNLYNKNIALILEELVEQYRLPPSLLNLEITESAYTDNPIAISETIANLQNYGFLIMMDDFGSGYSSLNILKDIPVDVLKIDMRFLSKTKIPGRGENIIASILRMAKWLDIPAIVEGVETAEQLEFLRSVGCDYVQGFYFARPMPVSEYENLCCAQMSNAKVAMDKIQNNYNYDDLFATNSEMTSFFGVTLQAAAIYEVTGDKIELIRINDVYYDLFGHDDMTQTRLNPIIRVDEKHRDSVINACYTCIKTEGVAECEYLRYSLDGKRLWVHNTLKYISKIGNKHILLGVLTDITLKREINIELQKYRDSLLSHRDDAHTILIVDDEEINRIILKKIFGDEYQFLDAENGEDAFKRLNENIDKIDLILLDIVMPKMDGKEFLKQKKQFPEFDSIPVIMITADDSQMQQVDTLALGANDYITKPFIPEVVIRRTKNVLQYNRRFKEMVREYNVISEQVKMDPMTGLFNRKSAETMIAQQLKYVSGIHAMIMLDIDNFKKINDTFGHAYGDKVILTVAKKIKSFFRKDDIVSRMGGDEFSVFISNIPSEKIAEDKAFKLCEEVSDIKIDGNSGTVSCSIGIVISSDENDTFEKLYQNADKALYSAKFGGRSTVSIYGKDSKNVFPKWINDAEGIINTISDGIYVCDKNTYELLYANDFICDFFKVDKKNYKNKKCYEVMMKRTEPCLFCSVSKLSKNRIYTRIFSMPNFSRIFLMRGKEINWNGISAHLEVAVDVTKLDNVNLSLEEALKSGKN
ncbi:MAG: EAL domain-containing protein [Clostridia bacterium]